MTDPIPVRRVPTHFNFGRINLKPLPPATEAKVNQLAMLVRKNLSEEAKQSEFLAKSKELVAAILNEETTDLVASIIGDFIPWGLGKPVAWALDKLLPEKLLNVIFTLLDRIAD